MTPVGAVTTAMMSPSTSTPEPQRCGTTASIKTATRQMTSMPTETATPAKNTVEMTATTPGSTPTLMPTTPRKMASIRTVMESMVQPAAVLVETAKTAEEIPAAALVETAETMVPAAEATQETAEEQAPLLVATAMPKAEAAARARAATP